MSISGAQLTKLGERLRSAPLCEADLRLLDEYRRSFGPASEQVLAVLREALDVPVTVRGAKSTQAIVEKLRRQSCRLGQIQDIAGCRLVVPSVRVQDGVVVTLLERLPGAVLHDRRESPSHGYRAVHVVARMHERCVEIQVRTELQHQWASLSELLADIYGIEVKYGGGPTDVQSLLGTVSRSIADVEFREHQFADLLQPTAAGLGKSTDLTVQASSGMTEELTQLESQLNDMKRILREALQEIAGLHHALKKP
jgi:putative GTP pyrophosphokinase